MAQKKTVRKPAAKRSKAQPKRSFGSVGWLAAFAIGIGWLASDGRPVAYLQSALVAGEEAGKAALEKPAPRRVAATDPQAAIEKHKPFQDQTTRILAAPTQRPKVTQASATNLPPPPKPSSAATREDNVARLIRQVPEPLHVAAIAPSSAPRRPSATLPLRTTAPENASPRPQAFALQTPFRPAGSGERHATRDLAVHSIPDPGTERVATIDAGSTVTVLKSEGAWRLVRTAEARGWVDGRYLAGEQVTVDASAHPAPMPPPAAFSERKRPVAARGFSTAPIPPMAIASE